MKRYVETLLEQCSKEEMNEELYMNVLKCIIDYGVTHKELIKLMGYISPYINQNKKTK